MKLAKEMYKDMKREELIHELERYKRGCYTRDIMIEEMREEMVGQYQVGQILAAYIALLVGEAEQPIGKQVIADMIGKWTVEMKDGEKNYLIKAVKLKAENEVSADAEEVPATVR